MDRLRRVAGGDRNGGGAVQAVWNGRVIAESDRFVRLEGNYYFPLADIRLEYLEPSERRSVCPWKGVASYFDVVVDGLPNPGAAWYYAKPSPLARKIKDHVAFWQGIELRRKPRDQAAYHGASQHPSTHRE